MQNYSYKDLEEAFNAGLNCPVAGATFAEWIECHNLPIKTPSKGVELIADERQHQIDKHGFTAEHHAKHPEWYDKGQLVEAANTLTMIVIKSCMVPINWDIEWFKKLCEKPYQERLIISSAL